MRTQVLLLFGLILVIHQSCKPLEKFSIAEPSENVIATFADQQVTLDELKTNFNRNRNSEEIDSSELRNFYPSYITYRLKLYDGYQQGYHKDSTILSEFNEYASEIANRYWIENEIKSQRIETFRIRFKKELKVFHILKELPEETLTSDTTEIYNSLLSIRDSLLNGVDPELMNEKYSSKRDGLPMGGQLSWITAGNTIQPFEDAVYNLDPGEVSYPVRSQFGYHLILLQEIRPRTPKRLVRHIFVRKVDDGSGLQKINQAYKALEADSSWSNVLQKYTEDSSSKNLDGSLGWVGYGTRFPQELVEAAIKTDPDYTFSEPYEVSYGYHIMRVDSVRTFVSEEQHNEFIVNRMEELGRLNPDQKDIYDRISRESNLKIYRDNFSQMFQSKKEASDLDSQSELDLIYFNNHTYRNSDFQYWLDNISSADDVIQSGNLVKSFRDYIIQQNYVDYTRYRFPEYTHQVDYFLDGLIVFKVNEENIWNLETVDRTKLKEFYKSNQTDYKKGKTFYYSEISAKSDSIMQVIYGKISTGTTIKEISEQFEDVRISSDSTSYSQSPAYLAMESLQPGEFSKPISVNNRRFIYILNDINDERIMSFEEAIDQVFTDYQPIREENYINELRKRHELQLFPENLN